MRLYNVGDVYETDSAILEAVRDGFEYADSVDNFLRLQRTRQHVYNSEIVEVQSAADYPCKNSVELENNILNINDEAHREKVKEHHQILKSDKYCLNELQR